jgi:acetylornithine deacetylase/succinyl-diaminopimelate desuccinylase-like protein
MVSIENNPARDVQAARKRLAARLESSRDQLIRFCSELGRIDSRNPPGDTTAMVAACRGMLDGVAGIAVEEIAGEMPKVNLIATLSGGSPGARLVMNGHLDTGPVVDPELWTVPPFGGVIAAGRIYGRGIADMKAGVAVDVLAMSRSQSSANTCAANSCSCWWATRAPAVSTGRNSCWRRGPNSPAMR